MVFHTLFFEVKMYDELRKLSNYLNKTNHKDEAEMVKKLAQEVTDQDIIIATLIGEASVDGSEGMTAVYSIIKNRANHKGISMKDVCLEPKQFSMWNDKSNSAAIKAFIEKSKNAPGGLWAQAERIVISNPGDTTFGSTHYYTGSTPYWATNRNPCWIYRTKIGSHVFGIDSSIGWVSPNKMPTDIQKAYLREGREPARCYVDKPNRYPPRSIRK